MKARRMVGWVIMIPAMVFWLYAIGGASNAGLFADAFDYQVIVMGGALSTLAALLLNADVFAS